MTLILDYAPQPDSPLGRLDPRWKLAALAPAVLASALLHTLPAAVLTLAGSLILVLLGRLPWRWYLSRLATASLFLFLFVVLLPFILRDDGPSWQFGPVRVSWYGLHLALLICAKALALITLILVVLATAPLTATLKAAHALHVPGLLVQLATLTYRYIFVLAAELTRLRNALRVRGYRSGVNRHSYRTLGHVTGTLLVRGSERGERVGQAMRCRGFDGTYRSLAEFRTTSADLVFFLVLVGSATALWLWDFRQP